MSEQAAENGGLEERVRTSGRPVLFDLGAGAVAGVRAHAAAVVNLLTQALGLNLPTQASFAAHRRKLARRG